MHIIGAWLIGKGYELISKKKLSRLAWGLLLLGGILPDIDLILDWIIGTEIHRSITHSLFFMILVPAVLYLIFKLLKTKVKAGQITMLLGAGIAMHIILDMFFWPGVVLLWPYNLFISFTEVGIYSIVQLKSLAWTYSALKESVIWLIADMAAGTCWIAYLWFKGRIQF